MGLVGWICFAVTFGFIIGYVGQDVYEGFFKKGLYEPPKELEDDDEE